MRVPFTKMHGLGNDYVFIDSDEYPVRDAPALARAMSDRHRGVGSDGLILVSRATEVGDVRMIMYNADGSRAEMCGNGIRCVGKLAFERGWVASRTIRVESDAGVRELELDVDRAGRVTAVRVDMGRPVLAPAEIPVICADERAVDVPLRVAGRDLRVTCVGMGNPHAVLLDRLYTRAEQIELGPLIENFEIFPARTNVHFVQVLNDMEVEVVTWERGAGFTQACGTGACAAVVAGVLHGLTQRTVLAKLPGGLLRIEWDAASDRVFMHGGATEVFSGVWDAGADAG